MDSNDAALYPGSDSDEIESLMTLPFTQTSFLATYQQQAFPFQHSLMNYISKNPKSPQSYQKMIQICKYFFISNPIIIVSSLSYGWHEGLLKMFFNGKYVSAENISSKIWIVDTNEIVTGDLFIMPKIYRRLLGEEDFDAADDAAEEEASNAPSESNSETIESLMILPFTQASFFATYRQQAFPFRSTLMNYISKNSKSTKCYKKMVKTCKYFFIANPILIISTVSFDCHYNVWRTRFNEKLVNNFDQILSKIWIIKGFSIWGNEPSADDYLFSIIPKIYRCDAEELTFYCKNDIAYKDLIFLGSKCENIWLSDVNVVNDDGSSVVLEKIVEAFPAVKYFNYYCPNNASITSKTVKELIKIPHFTNLIRLSLNNVPQTFDIDSFYAYIKQNKKTKILCYFSNALSDRYKTRLQEIIDELGVEAENPARDYKMPDIFFDGVDLDAHRILYNHFYYLE